MAKSVYQLKIILEDFKPPIWRRVLIEDDASFFELHSLIQDAFDWEDSHLHTFRVRLDQGNTIVEIEDLNLVDPDPPFISIDNSKQNRNFKNENEHKTKIKKYLGQENSQLVYEYDFGDSWRHQILLEEIVETKDSWSVPAIIAGKQLAPPENSRGWAPDFDEYASIQPGTDEWQHLVDRLGGDKEEADYIVSMSQKMANQEFDPAQVEITEPEQRRQRYQKRK